MLPRNSLNSGAYITIYGSVVKDEAFWLIVGHVDSLLEKQPWRAHVFFARSLVPGYHMLKYAHQLETLSAPWIF